MSRRSSTIGLFVVVALLAGRAREVGAADVASHVVVISIDGLAGYLLDDPKAPLPTIRRLAKEGAQVVGGMKVSNPSVTWPNHTSLVTGVRPERHGVLANGVLMRGAVGVPVAVDAARDKTDLVRVPTIYDAAHAAGLSTAEVNWPCTRNAATLDDSFPDVPEAVRFSTPRLRAELVAAGLLTDETDKSFAANSVVGRDYIWTETACHLIRTRKPNLLLLHLLNVDATHHGEGPQSGPGYTANAYADACVGRVLQALREAGILDRTTVFIVADHGFTQTLKAVQPNVLLRREGLLRTERGKVTEAEVNVVPEGGVGLVYCNVPGRVEADRRRVQDLFAGREGVAAVLLPEQFAEHGLPSPRDYAQAPDLVIAAADGYGVSGSADGDEFVTTHTAARVSVGSHGFLADNPKMNALCVMWGRGIRAGARVTSAENIDVAPTIARLLSLTAFQADGRVPTAVLNEP